MTRFILMTAALALSGCNQAEPQTNTTSEPAATAGTVPALAEARVDLAPVAPGKAKAVMHERHEGMEKIGKLMKQLSRAMKSEPLDLAAIKASAAAMNAEAKKSVGWFPAGTGPEAGKTGAKPEIWQKPADFTAKLGEFHKAAAAFDAAAGAGEASAVKAAFGDLGKSCKACHDLYRSKEEH